jgi:hypothetical protein
VLHPALLPVVRSVDVRVVLDEQQQHVTAVVIQPSRPPR